jgi:hypothetical protein
MSGVETSVIQKRFLENISALVPGLSDAGYELLKRVSTPNWTVEWSMPIWLSERFAFSPALCEELLLSNIIMIAYARVLDDFADQEGQAYDGNGAVLDSALHHIWTRQYINLFCSNLSDSQDLVRFWDYFDIYTRDWLRATLNIAGEGFPPFASYADADFQRLAARGAFLKICPAAACILAGQTDVIPPLTSAVEYLTVGIVMLDEQFDWAKDLDASRYNTFVAYCSDLPQTGPHREANHAAILKEIYLGRSGQPYFEILCGYLQKARSWAAVAGCAGLVDYIDWFEKETRTCGSHFLETARAHIQAVAELYRNGGNLRSISNSEDK